MNGFRRGCAVKQPFLSLLAFGVGLVMTSSASATVLVSGSYNTFQAFGGNVPVTVPGPYHFEFATTTPITRVDGSITVRGSATEYVDPDGPGPNPPIKVRTRDYSTDYYLQYINPYLYSADVVLHPDSYFTGPLAEGHETCCDFFLLTSMVGSGAFTFSISPDLTASPAPVPEPESWAMAIIGMAAIGGVLRRRRQLTIW
jgi:hypothetical protein